MKKLLFILLIIISCNNHKYKGQKQSAENKRKSDSILKTELIKAKIPYNGVGINEELLEKYLTQQAYKDHIFIDRKVYKHESNRKRFKVTKINDFYRLKEYDIRWKKYTYKDYIFKEDAQKALESKLEKNRRNYNTNTYALWKIREQKKHKN